MGTGEFSSILALIALLGHDKFAVRESTQRLLEKVPAAVMILSSAQRWDDQEINNRVGQILKHHEDERDRESRVVMESVFLQLVELPWLDSLPLDWPKRKEVISYYFNRSFDGECVWAAVYSRGSYGSWRAATAIFFQDKIKAGMPKTEAADLLRKMNERCLKWDSTSNRWTDEAVP